MFVSDRFLPIRGDFVGVPGATLCALGVLAGDLEQITCDSHVIGMQQSCNLSVIYHVQSCDRHVIGM